MPQEKKLTHPAQIPGLEMTQVLRVADQSRNTRGVSQSEAPDPTKTDRHGQRVLKVKRFIKVNKLVAERFASRYLLTSRTTYFSYLRQDPCVKQTTRELFDDIIDKLDLSH